MKSDSHQHSTVDSCVIIDLPRRIGENGCLTEVENTSVVPFDIKRVYYIYDLPADTGRGGHSHYECESLLVAVSGSFDVTLHDGCKQKTVTLDRPYKALYRRKGIWSTLSNFSSGAVCLSINSEKYDEADYVRDFADFMRLTSGKCGRGKPRYPFLDLATVNAPYMEALQKAACEVIRSGYYVGGPQVEALEQKMCEVCQTPYAVAVSNGLDALRLMLRGYMEMGRLAPGDEVIVPADTYIATVLAVTDNGLKPVFVDTELDTFNISAAAIEAAITPRTKAVLLVHLYGRVCWEEDMNEIAKKHNLLILEDTAQAIGAMSANTGIFGAYAAGGLGHASGMSFYPTKNVGALGDAGIVTTHDAELARLVRSLRDYGRSGTYANEYKGLNCRMDPIQAAMLMVKLPYLEQENNHRRRLADIYDEMITNALVVKPKNDCNDFQLNPVWHQYVIMVKDRERFREYLLSHGVETGVHYPIPPHKQQCYSEYNHLSMPNAERIAEEVVSLPISTCTSEQDAHEISEIINNWKG